MSVATQQPPAGFTAVNGASPPSWSNRPRPYTNHSEHMDSHMFANSRPDESSHYRVEDSESRKRKRDDVEGSSPHSNSSQRQHNAPPTSQVQTQTETLPPITNGQPNGAPYTTQEPNAHTNKLAYTNPNNSNHWHQQRSSMDDTTTESRLMQAFDRDGQHPQPNGSYHMQHTNGNAPPQDYSQPGGPDGQQNTQGQQSSDQQLQSLPGVSAPHMQKQRKRNFANRTKTGCLTCRERKKKCDEAKPMCTNCQRGGFDCKGYSQTHQLRHGSLQPPIMQKPDGGPFAVHGTVAYTTPPFPPNAMYYHPPPDNGDHSRPPLPVRDDPSRGFIDPGLPPSYSRNFADTHISPFASESMRHDYGQSIPTMPDFGREKKQLPPPGSMALSSSMAPAPYARGSPQNMAQMALSSNVRTEKEKMVNQTSFDPNDHSLRQDRERCAKFLYAFNKGCEDPSTLKPHEKADRFRAIIEGRDPTSSSPRGVADLRSGQIGMGAEVQAPFHCDYGFNVRIGDNTEIGRNCTMLDACTVKIGRNCIIGPDVKFFSQDIDRTQLRHNSMMPPPKRLSVAHPISVEDGVYIGGGSIVLPGITIGAGAVIPPGSIVDKAVKAQTFAVHESNLRFPTAPWNAQQPPMHHRSV